MNLFGYEIIKKNKDTVTTKNNSDVMYPMNKMPELIGNNNPSWINFGWDNLKLYIEYYNKIPELFMAVEKISTNFTKGQIKLFKTNNNGEIKGEITNDPILKLLKNPNSFQGRSEFLKMINVYYNVLGLSIIYRRYPLGYRNDLQKNELYVLPVENLDIKFKNFDDRKNLFGDNVKDIIEYIYLETFNGKRINLTPILDDLIFINEVGIDCEQSYYFGNSRIKRLDFNISNIKAAYETENVIFENRGALTLITPEPFKQDEYTTGVQTLNPDEKAILETAYSAYGAMRGQKNTLVSTSPLKVQQLIQDYSKLQLGETILRNFKTIVGVMQVPPILLNLEDSTFNNLSEAKKELIEEKILPDFQYILDNFNVKLGVNNENKTLIGDFSHLPCMQKDAKLEADKIKINTDVILLINKAVSMRELTHEIGVNQLIESGYSEEVAESLIIKDPENENEINQGTNQEIEEDNKGKKRK